MWRTLMVDVLGYPRFFAQSGDWGSAITMQLGPQHADEVAAIQLNWFLTVPPDTSADKELRDFWGKVGDGLRWPLRCDGGARGLCPRCDRVLHQPVGRPAVWQGRECSGGLR